MNTAIIEKVVEKLQTMPTELQWQVLAFTRAVSAQPVKGTSGKHLLSFAGTISTETAEEMLAVIALGCEQIDDHEW